MKFFLALFGSLAMAIPLTITAGNTGDGDPTTPAFVPIETGQRVFKIHGDPVREIQSLEGINHIPVCDVQQFDDFEGGKNLGGGFNHGIYFLTKNRKPLNLIAKKIDASFMPDIYLTFFKNELNAAAKLSSFIPQIARIECYFMNGSDGYIVKEYVPRVNLDTILEELKQKNDSLIAPMIAFFVINILSIVFNAHKEGMGFIDIKAENFGLDKDGNFKWFDLGTVRSDNLRGRASVDFNHMVNFLEHTREVYEHNTENLIKCIYRIE